MTTILSREAAEQLEQKSAAVNAKAQGQQPQEAAAAGGGELDLQTIHPDVPFSLAGRMVTMREYGHIEGLRLLAWAKPFVEGLYATVAGGKGKPPTLSQIRFLMAEHADLVRDMTAQAITTPNDDQGEVLRERKELAQWIERIGDRNGQLLLSVWWQVNLNFFFRLVFERALETVASQPAGHASTTP